MQFLTNTHINFIAARRYAIVLSVLMILAGIVSLVVNTGRGSPSTSAEAASSS